MKIDILTLFPEMISGVLYSSILKRAQENDKFSYNLVNLRDYAQNKHEKVDDYPYGGGAGMVLQAQPIFDAVASVMEKQQTKPRIILMCPQGKPFNQAIAEELADEEHLIFICGHYERSEEHTSELQSR